MPGRTAPASANRSSRAVGEEEVDRRTDDARKRIGVRARTTGKPVCGKKAIAIGEAGEADGDGEALAPRGGC